MRFCISAIFGNRVINTGTSIITFLIIFLIQIPKIEIGREMMDRAEKVSEMIAEIDAVADVRQNSPKR